MSFSHFSQIAVGPPLKIINYFLEVPYKTNFILLRDEESGGIFVKVRNDFFFKYVVKKHFLFSFMSLL